MTGPRDGRDDAVSSVRNHVEDLSAALEAWHARDDTRPQPGVRRAANDAMDAIDGALAQLHALRQRLVSEIRVSDDASAKRADELLARPRPGAS